jgi:hypothetical protein
MLNAVIHSRRVAPSCSSSDDRTWPSETASRPHDARLRDWLQVRFFCSTAFGKDSELLSQPAGSRNATNWTDTFQVHPNVMRARMVHRLPRRRLNSPALWCAFFHQRPSPVACSARMTTASAQHLLSRVSIDVKTVFSPGGLIGERTRRAAFPVSPAMIRECGSGARSRAHCSACGVQTVVQDCLVRRVPQDHCSHAASTLARGEVPSAAHNLG